MHMHGSCMQHAHYMQEISTRVITSTIYWYVLPLQKSDLFSLENYYLLAIPLPLYAMQT